MVLMLGRVDVETLKETEIADFSPIPPAFDLVDSLNDFTYRGFSLCIRTGRAFSRRCSGFGLGCFLMKDFNRSVRLVRQLVPPLDSLASALAISIA